MTIERLLSSILTVAAVVIAVAVARREFATDNDLTGEVPTFVSTWTDAEEIGIALGAPDAVVTIVEFVDFECPVCRIYHETLKEAFRRRGDDLRLIFVHYPLVYHRNAVRAAHAAECAAAEGVFSAYQDSVYSRQEDLAELDMVQLLTALAPDRADEVTACLNASVPATVAAGQAMATSAGVGAVPAILVNGWKFEGIGVSADGLMRLVDAMKDGLIDNKTSPRIVRDIATLPDEG